MTLCWDDHRTRAMLAFPLAPVAVLICVLLLARTFFDLIDALSGNRSQDIYTAMRVLLNLVPGLFAVFALVGMASRNATLTLCGAWGVWPVLLTLFLCAGMRWWLLLARNVTGNEPGSGESGPFKPTAGEWNKQWMVTAVDVLMVLALLYCCSIFKRIANLFKRGGDPWHVHQAAPEPEMAVELGYGSRIEMPAGVEGFYGGGQDQIVQPAFHSG